MSNPQSNEAQVISRGSRVEYAIGDSGDCPHLVDRRRYLGHQGPVAFYQCQQCESVIVRSANE